MNYALDALWWRLQTPAVRDLAVLLTAPPPWHSGHELPVRTLLGEGGFRYLLALDASAGALADYLAARAPFGHRLGHYAETLLAFWLANAPHSRLHAHRLHWRSADGQRAGEADFVAELNGRCYHIELACKYCGAALADAASLCGFDRHDTLAAKAARLTQQLAQPQQAAFQAAAAAQGLPAAACRSVSVLRGMLFLPPSSIIEPPLNRYGWQGVWGRDWPALLAALGDVAGLRFAVIDRMALLAPQRLPLAATVDAEAIQNTAQGMVAVLQPRADGYWHETQRLMKINSE